MRWLSKRKANIQTSVSEQELRLHRCAFTGHRPEKVTGLEGSIIVELRKEILHYTLLLQKLSTHQESRRTTAFCVKIKILIERRTYHAHGAMEAHEHIIDRSHRRSMAFLLVKCDFDIVAIPYQASLRKSRIKGIEDGQHLCFLGKDTV